MSTQPRVLAHQEDVRKVVMGPAEGLRQRLAKQGVLSVEQQVDCLVEQATDPNILGRTWIGWSPWL